MLTRKQVMRLQIQKNIRLYKSRKQSTHSFWCCLHCDSLAHSPPANNPCENLKIISNMGASMPTVGQVGIKPVRNVTIEIPRSLLSLLFFFHVCLQNLQKSLPNWSLQSRSIIIFCYCLYSNVTRISPVFTGWSFGGFDFLYCANS